MKDKNCKGSCNINLNDENEYEYILNELEDTRNRIDDIIKLIEQRTKKDAIINEVLKCNCDEKDKDSNIDIEEVLRMLALKNILQPYKKPYYPTYYYEF